MTLRASDVQKAYGGAAGAWAAGPSEIYRRMAEPLVADCPITLGGAHVLDFGAGTGATSAVLESTGAQVTAADLSLDMLRADQGARPPAVNADVLRLPFHPRVFDVAVGAFVISHLPDPAAGLHEVAGTVRTGGVLMTVGFDGRWEFAAKQTVEDVMTGFGLRRPEWYETFKRDVEPLTAFPEQLAAVARDAGLTALTVHEHAVDVGVRTADGIIAWRLGTPTYAPFMAGLDEGRRSEMLEMLREALGPEPEALVPELLVLVARVGD
jgi:ubiquinone/menaquinone biosynthesis C-methylase UbiE